MYILQVIFLTGSLTVGGIESKVACESAAARFAQMHDVGFVKAVCARSKP